MGRNAEQSPTLALGRTATSLARQVARALSPLDLSAAQYQVLVAIADGLSSSARLAKRLSVTPPTVSAIVEGMVGRGWLSRRADPSDRRLIALELTPEGVTALEEADRAVSTRMIEIVDELGVGPRREKALDGLQLWSEALELRVARRTAALSLDVDPEVR